MKRLFILSAAVAALASCSNSEVITEVNEPQVPDKAIAFETFSSNATREGAENSGQTKTDGLEEHHNNFQVWGYKDVQADYVFNGTEVTYESSVWAYSPIRFWDKAAKSYYFYACAPSTANATPKFQLKQVPDPKWENDYFILSDVRLEDETLPASTTLTESYRHDNAKNIDYMIASQCNIATSSSSQAVQLDFNHILSRLNIGVKKASKTQDNPFNGAIVKLIKLKVDKMKSTGSFDESKTPNSGSLNEGTTVRWDSPSGELCYTGAVDASNGTEVNTSETFFLQSLVIPQNVNYENVQLDGTVTDGTGGTSTTPEQAYLYIKYKIQANASDTEGETFVRYINLAQAFGSSTEAIAFNEGWQNTLHITIDADVISFTADVYKWDDNKTYNLDSNTGKSSNTSTSGGN